MDLTTLIFLGIAVFFILKLRGVLGKRTGHEGSSFDPYSERKRSSNDNVVAMPKRNVEEDDEDEEVDPKVLVYREMIAKVQKRVPDFEDKEFLVGAHVAYEMIVTAFAAGDRSQLKDLLSKDVYKGFDLVISDRESKEESVEFSFVGIERSKIVDASATTKEIRIVVRFVSELISATLNKAGEITDGDPKKIAEVTDIWTFARDPREDDPNWRLVATEAVSQ